MINTVEIIKEISSFADKDGGEFGQVFFDDGECYAQTITGGASAPIDLKIQCGIDAVSLRKALRAVKGEPTFRLESDQLVITHDETQIKLPTNKLRNAPKLHRPPKGSPWREIVLETKRIAWIVEDDFTHPECSGIWLTDIGLIGSNGYGLVQLRGTDFSELFGSSCLAAEELMRNLPLPCYALRSEQRLFFTAAPEQKAFRTTALLSAKQPPFARIIESAQAQTKALVNRKQFLDVLKRASLANSELVLDVRGGRIYVEVTQTGATLFSFTDHIVLAEDEGISDGRIGVDSRYLVPIVEHSRSDVIGIRMSPKVPHGVDPITIEDGDYFGLVLPRRLI